MNTAMVFVPGQRCLGSIGYRYFMPRTIAQVKI